MLTYKKFYLSCGIKIPSQLVTKTPLLMDQFGFPKYSFYHYTDGSETAPDSKVFYLDYDKKLPMILPEILVDPKGYKLYSARENKFLSLMRKEKTFQLLTHQNMLSAINPNLPVVVNHNKFAYCTEDKPGLSFRWDRYQDRMKNLFLNIESLSYLEHHHYVMVQTQGFVPKLSIINQQVKNDKPKTIDTFIKNDTARFILDLFKFIDKSEDNKKTSSFYGLKEQTLSKMVFVIRNETNFLLLNMGLVLSLSQDKKTNTKLKRMLLVLFLRLHNHVNEDIEEDEIDSYIDKSISKNNQNQPINEKKTTEVVTETPGDIKKDALEYKDPTTIINEKLEAMGDEIPRAKAKKLKRVLGEQKDKESPFDKNQTIGESVKIDSNSLKVTDADIKVPVGDVIIDEKLAKEPLKKMDKKYIKEIMPKHYLRNVLSIQNADMVIEDYKVDTEKSITGEVAIHTIKITPLDGETSTLKIRMPVVNEDGEFTMSGTTYRMKKQRVDAPIRKIGEDRVALTSYYGRLFIDRSMYKRFNAGYYLANKIIKLSQEDGSGITEMIAMDISQNHPNIPLLYSEVSSFIKGFKFKGYVFSFDYDKREKTFRTDTKKLEIKNTVLVGKFKNEFITMNKEGDLFFVKNGRLVPKGNFYTILSLPTDKIPGTPAHIKIMTQPIAIGLVLGYYLGLDKLFKMQGIKYETYPSRGQVADPEYKIILRFADKKLAFNRKMDENYLILSSLATVKELKEFDFSEFNSKAVYYNILSGSIIREIDNIRSMFVDPNTRDILVTRNEPETMVGLLIRSCELLLSSYHPNQQDLNHMALKGYERMTGLMYKEMVKSVKQYKRNNIFGKGRVTVDPYELWNNINADSSVVIVEDFNPVATLKQIENVTYLGEGGRSKDTMAEGTRKYHVSDLGVISESVVDSGDVGITAYMSAIPNLNSLTGLKEKEFNLKEQGAGALLSTSALLAPASDTDSPNRTNFISIQNTHVIPIQGSKQSKIRTPYAYVMPYKVSDKFAYMAEQDGVVKTVSKSKIVIEYKDGTSVTKNIGNSYSREEVGTSYKNQVVTTLEAGDKVKLGDPICFNNNFFEYDWLFPKKLIHKSASEMTIAIGEGDESYEDSHVITKKASEKLVSNVVKITSNTITDNMIIDSLVSVGDKIKAGGFLFVAFEHIDKAADISPELLESIKSSTQLGVKSKYNGTVEKIEVRYNGELETMSQSVRKIVEQSNADLAKRLNDKKITGKVGNEYSVNGRRLGKNTVEIKIFILTEEPFGNGDKSVLVNQLKTTAAMVVDDEIKTEDGRDVDILFSSTSLFARQVPSSFVIGTSNVLLDLIKQKAVKLYFES